MTTAPMNPAPVDVTAALGIRYATTARRFDLPQPAQGRPEARTLAEVPIFPQLPGRLDAAMGSVTARHAQSEDAFHLNVWAPRTAAGGEGAAGAGLPVMVFIHGGAWSTGGGALEWYDGSALAARGMVVVTCNYRISAIGHLNARSRTAGIDLPARDLLLVLQWVHDHIGAHGGDPDRVTLVGQSAGAWYAHLLNVTPEARGLFARTALLSLPRRQPWTPPVACDFTDRAIALSGHRDLADAPVDDLLRAGAQALATQERRLGIPGAGYLPTESVLSDGQLPRLFDAEWCASRYASERVWLRTTSEETAAFFFQGPEREATLADLAAYLGDIPAQDRAPHLDPTGATSPYATIVEQSTWHRFGTIARELADALTATGIDARTSLFDHRSPLAGFGAGHTLDLPYQFGIPGHWADAPMLADEPLGTFEAVSEPLVAELAAFVTST